MRPNKIIFNTWSGAFFHPGGGEVQLLNSKKELEKIGLEVNFYNQWSPDLDKNAIYHQFSIEPGTESVLSNYKKNGNKVVISPIMWNLFKRDHCRYSVVKRMFELADILMTNSRAESLRLARHFSIPLEKFHETRNSITNEYLDLNTSRNFRKEYNLKEDFILSVANIDTRKNTESLVKACKELDLTLICIGSVRDEAYFNRFKSLYNKAQFIGPVFDIDLLKSAYQQCSIFALPSFCETPGISAIEALSQGAKLLITQEGATFEYFQDNVSYVDPNNIESILSGLIEQGSFKADASSIDFVRDRYQWSKTAQDINFGYKKLFST